MITDYYSKLIRSTFPGHRRRVRLNISIGHHLRPDIRDVLSPEKHWQIIAENCYEKCLKVSNEINC